jgi:phosphomannomutase
MPPPNAPPRDYFRYCPGEEHIKLSNAVCRGRRRSNFIKCKGCQFNDDERKPDAATQEPSMSTPEANEALAKVFKAYDVRATVPEPLSVTAAWRIGYATAQFLRTKISSVDLGSPGARTVVVGRDMRTHSPMLQGSFIEGVRAAGLDVVNIGLIDTSQIYFAVNHLGACGGVQTTASHNPAPYNGFKICASGGKPVGSGTGLESIRDIACRVPKHQTGTTARLSEQDLAGPYKAFVRKFLHDRPTLARPLKVVVDASNGCAGRWFPILFGDVPGLTTIPLYFEHDGTFVHEPNPLIDTHLADLRDLVRRERADLGACFDGDADRCVFIDEKGNILRSDFITALLARVFLEKNPGATIVYDLRSSRVVKEEIEKAGGIPVRDRVGHAFMKKTLAERNGVFGGELSGHFYFRDNWFCDSGMLAFVHVVNLLADSGRKMSELVKPLRRLHATGEINFENPDQDQALAEVLERFKDAECDQLDGVTVQYPTWWFNIRKSNTEPLLRLNLEANTKKLMDQKLAELAPLLGTRVAH